MFSHVFDLNLDILIQDSKTEFIRPRQEKKLDKLYGHKNNRETQDIVVLEHASILTNNHREHIF